MNNKILLALLITGVLFIAACGSQEAVVQDNEVSQDLDDVDQLADDLDVDNIEDLEKDLQEIENY